MIFFQPTKFQKQEAFYIKNHKKTFSLNKIKQNTKTNQINET